MDEIDFHSLFALEHAVKRKIDNFLKVNGIVKFDHLKNLIVVNFILMSRGKCYDYDVNYLISDKRTIKGPSRYCSPLYHLTRAGLLKRVKSQRNPTLKRGFEITEKGYSVLDNYRSMFNRIENEMLYDLKKAHSEAAKV